MLQTSTLPGRSYAPRRLWLTLSLLLLTALGSPLLAYDLVVAKDGTGNYTTVQAAINAAPTGRTAAYTIFIKNGRYKEKISVPANKPFLQLIGESVAGTILTYDDGASTPAPGGGTVGTQNSASFSVGADDFSALNITFENTFGDGSQAVAVLVNADRAAFKNCRFLGNQDTLYTKGNGTPRHYFKDCYIDGNVDFIFGSSVALFDNCVVYAKARTSTGSSFITAANTPAGQTYGYVFKKTKLPANPGGTLYYLGRPWQNSTGSSPLAANKTVFISSTVGAGLLQPAGWTTWDAGTNTSLITYAEFQSKYYSGTLLPTSQRVAWSRQLAAADTGAYSRANLFGTWDPCTVAAGFCTGAAPDIAVSNFRAVKGATQATISWNISWAMSQIKYELFRSADNTTFSKIYEVTAPNDSTVNFQTTDALPASGTAYYYYLRASKAGLADHTTETIQVSSVQTINVTGTLGAFTQYAGGPSATQTYTLGGVNLTGNVTVTPPAGYEVSANGGSNWYTNASPLVLTPTTNTLANTTISVRLNAAAPGSYAGSISHTSPGATAVPVAVTGSRVTTSAPVSVPLQWWPLKAGNQDSAAIRSAAVTAAFPVMRNFYVSNGTTVPAIRAYSNTFGQAFGTTANGDGSWGTATGGPGGNLNRRFYEQFTVTAAAGKTLRVDSLVLTTAFYNTSSNTKLAVVWSRSGFASDSADVIGGRGPAGGLQSTANGAFATPIVLANQTAGPSNTYRLSLTGASGVTLTAGQTLTLRLYYSCGSSSAGRYAMLKNVYVTGEDQTPVACNAAFSYPSAAYCTTGPNPTPAVTGTTGGTFSSTTGLSLDVTTGAINLAGSTPGTYTVTYAASASCNSTAMVTITAPPTASFSIPGGSTTSFCAGSGVIITPALAAGATAGTFSSTAGLSINPTTGVITLATSAAGTYTITNTVAASGGCAAVTATATLVVNPRPAAPTFTVQYNGATTTLVSGQATGNQWLLNGSPIQGATGQTYVINSAGQYGSYTLVAVSAAGCLSVPSSAVTVTATSKPLAGTALNVFPNPTHDGQVTLELTGYSKAGELTVLNALGQVVYRLSVPAGQRKVALDLTNQPAGVYLLRLSSEGGADTRRIVRQ
jgi:pectinesterase